ncbi:MAG: histidine kinase [Gammaproteobacteria bacterium]|nr:MAG: histidine kinase [Gammaproteobacteria bacterium]
MLLKHAENTVFRRYNTAVVVAFIIIVFIALTAATLRYYSELSVHKQQSLQQLTEQTRQLNSMLEQSEQAISGIQEFAEYVLKNPEELSTQSPSLRQDGSLFFLDKPVSNSLEQNKRISGNITGFGNIEQFTLLKKQEIAMANTLTPAFVAAQKVIKEANWFYYVSLEQFVNIFPWIGRDSWRFSDRMLTNPHAQEIQKLGLDSNKVIWSTPYIDSAGTGMNVSLGIGVYRGKQMLGAAIIDISLVRLQHSLSNLTSDDQALVLFNPANDIFIFKQKGKEPLSYRATWEKLLPTSLHHLNSKNLAQLPDSTHIGNWLVEKQTLSINGWTLLKYQPYSSFILPLRSHFIYMFTLLLTGLIAFLMLVNYMTRRSFIKPTHDFISHIEYCAQGDPGKVKANADWLHWFVLVEDIFTQNRSLLLQLKEQNEVLDSRVLEKTQALLESSAKHQRDYVLLRSVMNAIPDLIIFNDPQGRLMGCNQAFEQLSGRRESDMFGFEASDFMPKALAHELALLNEEFDEEYPQQALIEAGLESYQGFCNQFVNDKGEILGTITILQDVTERQAIQSALEKAKNQAEYANQVKIQFLANMSHEIRTPINAMQGMMDLLTRTLLDPRQQHYIANAQTAGFSLLHLIDELLDLSKIEAGKMVIVKDVVDLASIIDKALKLNTASVYTKNLTMRVELAANVPNLLMSDEMRLVQVLSNLLNNAIKFTEQGEISLLVDSIGLSETNALIRFKVKDTGIGIAKDKQGHLFEAFSQADISMTRKYGGSGLGLSICQQIVKLLGGEITLKSDLGIGCEFSFVLPFSLPSEEVKQEKDWQNATGIIAQSMDIQDIHLCVIKEKVSTSCVETIESLSWYYHEFDDLVALNKQFANEDMAKAKVVLLISEEVFLQQKYAQKSSVANELQCIDLIGLCQQSMRELSSDICQQLDKMNCSYILLDTPLYRYSLDQIVRVLTHPSTSKEMVALTNTTISNKAATLINEDLMKGKENLSNIKVLLVEDNLVNQLVAKELLMSMKAEVMIADNGQRALDSLEEHTFDIILMDIQMPIMDGLTATKEIRKQEKYQSLPIIAMTAHAREEDKQRSLAAGMNLHIAKPVTAQLLLMSILQALALETT